MISSTTTRSLSWTRSNPRRCRRTRSTVASSIPPPVKLSYFRSIGASGRGSGNSRNGTRTKTVLTEIGPVEIDMPRDTGSTFDPRIVRNRQHRLTGVDDVLLSLSTKDLTTREIAGRFGEVSGARVSKDTLSRITERVMGEMTEWQSRPLDRVFPVTFIDAIFRLGPRRAGHDGPRGGCRH